MLSVLSFKQMGVCSKTPRPHIASRLSMLHKGRFKGDTYLSCNAQLLKCILETCNTDRSPFMWGIVGKIEGKRIFLILVAKIY